MTDPIRVPRDRLLRRNELERYVELAARTSGRNGRVLILLDADDDCPRDLAPQILSRARSARGDRLIQVVLAKREYETWFVAAAKSVAGHQGLQSVTVPPADPESLRNAKGWLSARMPRDRSYSPTRDQSPLTAVFDLEQARRGAPSFNKMWRAVMELL